jgi:hypothetical protein
MRTLKRAAPALATGIIGLTMMSAAAGTANAATPSTIHEGPCGRSTFNITYDVTRHVCLEGTGTVKVLLPEINKITSGDNTGLITWIRPAGLLPVLFHAYEKVPVPHPQPIEQLLIQIRHR